MLNGIAYDERNPNITLEHLKNAVRAIEYEFAFVGITERYDSSVCLFHAMYGGEPRAAEFLNTHPTKYVGRKVEDPSLLGKYPDEQAKLLGWGWNGAMDQMLYTVATRRFERDLAKHSECVNPR